MVHIKPAKNLHVSIVIVRISVPTLAFNWQQRCALVQLHRAISVGLLVRL